MVETLKQDRRTSHIPIILLTARATREDRIIDEKIGDADLDIPYLCRAVGLSSTQLHRKMKALTGEAPISFIRKVRLHKAKALLQTTDLTISEIAYDLGFNDPSYFSRAFGKEFGCAPSDFRD